MWIGPIYILRDRELGHPLLPRMRPAENSRRRWSGTHEGIILIVADSVDDREGVLLVDHLALKHVVISAQKSADRVRENLLWGTWTGHLPTLASAAARILDASPVGILARPLFSVRPNFIVNVRVMSPLCAE